jgi:hypothetical protein
MWQLRVTIWKLATTLRKLRGLRDVQLSDVMVLLWCEKHKKQHAFQAWMLPADQAGLPGRRTDSNEEQLVARVRANPELGKHSLTAHGKSQQQGAW